MIKLSIYSKFKFKNVTKYYIYDLPIYKKLYIYNNLQ